MRWFLILAVLSAPFGAAAETATPVERAITEHVMPGLERLVPAADMLAAEARADCSRNSAPLRSAYHDAFDAWVSVGHLRFGPAEVENRAFALAFWPDPRGKTSKALGQLLRAKDHVVDDPPGFRAVSVAARGFFALERLLFDPAFEDADPAYACKLVRAIAGDIAATAHDMFEDWSERYADLMISPGTPGNPYAKPLDPLRELFKALSTGLQFTSEIRLGRPLGTFDRPRPRRAEARRSGRSLSHVQLSLAGLETLAIVLADDHREIIVSLRTAFDAADDAVGRVGDPDFALVAQPQGRLRVEVLQQRIDRIREIVRDDLGPALGVQAGFNALDGD